MCEGGATGNYLGVQMSYAEREWPPREIRQMLSRMLSELKDWLNFEIGIGVLSH